MSSMNCHDLVEICNVTSIVEKRSYSGRAVALRDGALKRHDGNEWLTSRLIKTMLPILGPPQVAHPVLGILRCIYSVDGRII
jgi:hypothetical protein